MIEDYGLYYIYRPRAILLGCNALVIGFPEGGGPWADVGEYGDFIKNWSPSGGGNEGT